MRDRDLQGRRYVELMQLTDAMQVTSEDFANRLHHVLRVARSMLRDESLLGFIAYVAGRLATLEQLSHLWAWVVESSNVRCGETDSFALENVIVQRTIELLEENPKQFTFLAPAQPGFEEDWACGFWESKFQRTRHAIVCEDGLRGVL